MCKQLFLVTSYYNCYRLKLPYAHDSTPSIVHYFESKLKRGIYLNISLYTPAHPMVMIVIFEKTLTREKLPMYELGSGGRHLLNGCLLACDYSTVLFDIFVMT